MHQKKADKILTIIGDGRLTLADIDSIGYHIVNLSHRQVRKNALVLADAIMYHDGNPFDGGNDDQYTLF